MPECEHLLDLPSPSPEPLSTTCLECEAVGSHPVQLRICLSCGLVACCDSSVHRHATAHFKESGHPVMRTFEPGQDWRWCYVDQSIL